ncbi:MAG: phage shock protein PspC [Parcubacteria group bacterium]|nr:phage shock protein PspC [Parcubacteria group bacterium]
MNKVTTINLAGNAYQLEEPGYDKLHAYLNDATAKLGSNPDAQEIILDLERAIAEKCAAYLTHGKTVVSTSEVEQIIKDMGPVHAAEGDEHAPESKATPVDTKKRLYRVTQGRWIFGICNGLAAYFDVNVVAIRIMAVILLLATHGGLILVYIIAAMFIPTADTPEKRAAAHGVPFSTQDFIARAYDLSDEFKANSKEWKRYHRSMKRDYQIQHHMDAHGGWPFMGPLFGALSLLWVFALISIIMTHAIFGLALPATVPLWLAIVLMAILYSVLLSPLRYIAYAHGSHSAHDKGWEKDWDHRPAGPIGLLVKILVIWFIGWLLYMHVPEVRTFLDMVWTQLQQIPWLR